MQKLPWLSIESIRIKNIFTNDKFPHSMKKICSCLAACFLLASTIPAVSQRMAHQAPVNAIYPDMKGETVMTIDKMDTGKIWSLSDGNLLYKMHRKSPDWAIKMLRYKLIHPSYMQPGYSYDVEDLFAKDSNWMVYKIDGEIVARVRQRAGLGPRQHWNRATGKISYCITVNDTAYISLIDTKEPTGSNKRATLHPLARFNTTGSHPEFSPKGRWLICPYSGILVNTVSGDIVNIDKGAFGPEFSPSEIAFNADESIVSLANRKQQKMVVVETATGKLLQEYSVPKRIREDNGYYITPCSDGKSYVYSSNLYRNPGMKGDDKAAWIVKGSEVILLMD